MISMSVPQQEKALGAVRGNGAGCSNSRREMEMLLCWVSWSWWEFLVNCEQTLRADNAQDDFPKVQLV